MTYEIYFKNLNEQNDLKNFIKNEIYNLKVLYNEDINIRISISKNKNKFFLDLKTNFNNKIIKINKDDKDIYSLIIISLDMLEKQIIKIKQKKININIKKSFKNIELDNEMNLYENNFNQYEININEYQKNFKTVNLLLDNKKIKKITPEEACIQLELLGDNTYFFINTLNDKYSIIQKHESGYELSIAKV